MKKELMKIEEVELFEFNIQDLLPIGFTLIVLGIGLAYGLQVMSDVKGDMTVDSVEYNATGEAMEGVAKLPSKLPTIATIVVAAVIIGILVRYLLVRY